MINPIYFKLNDFIEYIPTDSKYYKSLILEDLSGSTLIDNLILLKFIDLSEIQEVLKTKYKIDFSWLNIDPTPKELEHIANKYGIMMQREAGFIYIYMCLGNRLDEASLMIDVPNYKFRLVYIADCNYRIIKNGLSGEVLTQQLADLRPLLILRRIIIDCEERAGTDVHFRSVYKDKVEHTQLMYRVKGELLESDNFKLDKEMVQIIIQAAVGKLSSASASDLDSSSGVTTDISDLYNDGTTDLRLTGSRVSAGFLVVIRIQNVVTTTMKVDELGFLSDDVATIRELSKRRTGLTLVTGKMRSGKNTTIFAMLNEIVDQPIHIIEYSNPVETRMEFPQINYRGDIELLQNLLRLAKKEDIDIAVLNEIPNSEVAFAVRDLVNSAVGVITTTHVDRVWHVPNKLNEFFGTDYKTIISQLNAVINQKMFRRWSGGQMQKRVLQPTIDDFSKFAYKCGVRQYFVPTDKSKVKYSLQPIVEIWVVTDEQKTAMLNFEEMWRAEQMIRLHFEKTHSTIENKLAQYINSGVCSLEELKSIY